MSEKKGLIYNIQRFTVHDGPGIRTEIFFKGCSLACKWCSNPESISPRKELGIYPTRCVGLRQCGLCVKSCPLSECPLIFMDNVIVGADRAACTGCFACTEACPADAVHCWGEEKTVDELLKIIVADRGFYQKSGGGVTLSGGEVLLQWEFARDLLAACKQAYIHTCVESAMHVHPKALEEVFPYTDLVISDIKFMNTQRHKQYVGQGNERILENLKRTVAMGKPLILRIPVVPGINDDEENIRATGAFIRDELDGKIIQLQLLPYRKLGTEKYESLNQDYPMGNDFSAPERPVWEERLLYLTDLLQNEFGLPATAGSNTKY